MPTPGTSVPQDPGPIPFGAWRIAPSDEARLADEIAALRREVVLLRAELACSPSIILTGKPVLSDYERLTRAL